MPTYDYECDACDHKFELFQQISENPKKVCPECKKRKVRRLIGSGGAIIFKGSGFYQTDYRSSEYKTRSDAETKPADSDSKKTTDAKTTETKTKETKTKETKKIAKESIKTTKSESS